jgi:hypothetical protein
MTEFSAGTTGNRRGRPKGAKSRAGALRQRFIDDFENIVSVVIESAKAGDIQAAKVCIDRALPALRPVESPVLLAVDANAPLIEQAGQVLAAAMAGKLPISQGVQMAGALSALAEKSEILERLAAIEKALNIEGAK